MTKRTSKYTSVRELWADPAYRAAHLAAITPEVRAKIAQASSERWKDPEYAAKVGAKISESVRAAWKRKGRRAQVSRKLKGHSVTAETRQKMSDRAKARFEGEDGLLLRENMKLAGRRRKGEKMWAQLTPDQRDQKVQAILLGNAHRPTKPEKTVGELLDALFPGEYRYTGDGSVAVAGKIPDFLNINGQKKIIEVFGDYWHRGENPANRKRTFSAFGFKTLVIWERELRDLETVQQHIIAFQGG